MITSVKWQLSVCRYALFIIFTLSLPAYAEPSEGMRYKTLSDVMDEYMRTKDPAWLIENIGEPDEKDPKYSGYTLWRWKTQYRSTNRKKVPCQQIFIIENSSNRIVGWRTNCLPEVPGEIYGEIAKTTPIPKIVTPEPILVELRKEDLARAKAKAEAEKAADAARMRNPTFSDWLASLIGQSEEKVFTLIGSPKQSQRLSNENTVNTYSLRWEEQEFDQAEYIAWEEGWGPNFGGMVTYKGSCGYSIAFKSGKVVGYDGGSCKDYPYTRGKPIHYKTPVAPWSTF